MSLGVIGDCSVCHTFVTLLFSFCEFAVHLRKTQLWSVASGGLLSRRGESRQRHAKGNLSRRRFPLDSFPIGQGAAAPLRSPGVYEGRGTKVYLYVWGLRQMPQAPIHRNHFTLFSRFFKMEASASILKRTFRRNHRAFAPARMRSIPANKDAGRHDHSAWIILA